MAALPVCAASDLSHLRNVRSCSTSRLISRRRFTFCGEDSSSSSSDGEVSDTARLT